MLGYDNFYQRLIFSQKTYFPNRIEGLILKFFLVKWIEYTLT